MNLSANSKTSLAGKGLNATLKWETEAKKHHRPYWSKWNFKKVFSLLLDFWSCVLKYVWKLQKHNILCPAVSISDFMDKSWMCGKSIKYVKCQFFVLVGNEWNIAIPWEAQIWRGEKKNLFWYQYWWITEWQVQMEVFACFLHFWANSPWYNRTGWLGIKHQLTYWANFHLQGRSPLMCFLHYGSRGYQLIDTQDIIFKSFCEMRFWSGTVWTL